MDSRRVVITGGVGFLGSHLCDVYIQRGWSVLALDNCVSGRLENVAHLESNPQFEFLSQDITEDFNIEGPVDLILNMASLASPPFYKRLPIETLRVGSIGTERMLKIAVEKKARFLMASTSEVYGDPMVSPQSEGYFGNVNPIGPRSMYDESKRYAEALVTAYRNAFDCNTGILRIFNTYGPRMRWDDGRVVTNFLCQLIQGQPLTIHGDGSQTRSFCYVGDLVDGIALMADSNHPGPINFGNPHNELSIRELAQSLSSLFGREFDSGPQMPRQDENDPMQRCPDITLAQDVLGWDPKVSLEDGMRATYDYLKSVLDV